MTSPVKESIAILLVLQTSASLDTSLFEIHSPKRKLVFTREIWSVCGENSSPEAETFYVDLVEPGVASYLNVFTGKTH